MHQSLKLRKYMWIPQWKEHFVPAISSFRKVRYHSLLKDPIAAYLFCMIHILYIQKFFEGPYFRCFRG